MDNLNDNLVAKGAKSSSTTLFPPEVVLSLSGEIAHELRTPLAVIQLYTELMDDNLKQEKISPLADKTLNWGEYCGIIKRTVRDTSDFIDNFLLHIRYISTSQKKGVFSSKALKRYSMQQTLKELLRNYPFMANERSAVKLNIVNNFYYHGEKIIVAHVVMNLLKNALAAIKEQGRAITIECTTNKRTGNGIVTVTDDVGAMDEKFSERAFDQFTSENFSYKNGGIGLHFCKMVMSNLGGTISCKVKKGQYTKMILHFPSVRNNKPSKLNRVTTSKT